MAYLGLARKYRPARFAELVGQGATSRALCNALALGREPHAAIFSGVRGVGKTTVARLYAKALNCQERFAATGRTPRDHDLKPASPNASIVLGEPCGRCPSCEALALGRHEDVVEIDGASHTGVDDVRGLIETVSYAPQRSKFKVYIIDEVHMLSQSAFNALLKTLEEPPAHVVFLFATTELNKVPATIQSRCQVFHLQKIGQAQIHDRLHEIFTAEGVPFDDKALVLLAREGRGSLRDAITLADQALALGDGSVSIATLSQFIDHVSAASLLALLRALLERNAERAMASLAKLVAESDNLLRVVEELAVITRHAFMAKSIGMSSLDARMLGLDADEAALLQELGAISSDPTDLNRLFRTLVRCRADLSFAALDRFVLENYCLEWCLDPGTLLAGCADISDEIVRTVGEDAGVVESRSGMAPRSAATAAGEVQPPSSRPQPAPPGLAGATKVSLSSRFLDSPTTDRASPAGAPLAEAPAPGGGGAPPAAVSAHQTPAASAPIVPPAKVAELPGSWEELVDCWKREKPLKARQLEAVHLLSYGPELIRVAADPATLAGGVLLQAENQARTEAEFRQIFAFAGRFQVVPLGAHEDTSSLGETLLTQRQREQDKRRAAKVEDVKSDPVTQALLSSLGGTITDIDLN